MFYTIIFTQYEQTCKSVILYKLKSKKITVEHSGGFFWCDRICYCSLTETFLNEVNYEVAISITNINILTIKNESFRSMILRLYNMITKFLSTYIHKYKTI